MVAHDFIVKDKKKMLKYKLIFDKKYCEIITIPAPSLFDILSGMYLVLPDAVYAYWSSAQVSEPELEPPLDPYRQSVYQWDPEDIDSQWQSDDASQYDPSYNFGYPPGHPWA